MCVSGIGSAVCSNRLTTGVQPSRNVAASTACSSRRQAAIEEDQHLDLPLATPAGRTSLASRRGRRTGTSPGRRRTRSAAGSRGTTAAGTATAPRPARSRPDPRHVRREARSVATASRRAARNTTWMAWLKNQLVERRREARIARQVEPKFRHRSWPSGEFAVRSRASSLQSSDRAASGGRQAGAGTAAAAGGPRSTVTRPERHRVAGAEPARRVADPGCVRSEPPLGTADAGRRSARAGSRSNCTIAIDGTGAR